MSSIRILSSIYKILGINGKDYMTNHRRGVFFAPLYSNYKEFLNGKIRRNKLAPLPLSDWQDWWLRKSKDRFMKLKNEKRVEKNILFNEKMKEDDLENYLGAKGAS